MGGVEQTAVPGVGILRTFLTTEDDWIGVLELRSGRRLLFVDDPSDPDARHLVADLRPEECHLLADLLGAAELTEHDPGADTGLIEWIQVAPGSAADGATIGDLELRPQTGATVAAVLRDRAHADVGPDFVLQSSDIVVVTGGQAALLTARAHLEGPRDTAERSATEG